MTFHIVSLSSKIPHGKYHVTKLSSHSPPYFIPKLILPSMAHGVYDILICTQHKVTDVGVDVEELKLHASLAGIYHCTRYGKDGRSLNEQSIEFSFDLSMPLLGTDTKSLKSEFQSIPCIALFTSAKKRRTWTEE